MGFLVNPGSSQTRNHQSSVHLTLEQLDCGDAQGLEWGQTHSFRRQYESGVCVPCTVKMHRDDQCEVNTIRFLNVSPYVAQ